MSSSIVKYSEIVRPFDGTSHYFLSYGSKNQQSYMPSGKLAIGTLNLFRAKYIASFIWYNNI